MIEPQKKSREKGDFRRLVGKRGGVRGQRRAGNAEGTGVKEKAWEAFSAQASGSDGKSNPLRRRTKRGGNQLRI